MVIRLIMLINHFHINNKYLICNGEIYNLKQLYQILDDVTPYSTSDCEIIIHLYEKFGIDQTLQVIDGSFAFILMADRSMSINFLLPETRMRSVDSLSLLHNPIVVDNVSSTITFASEIKIYL